jgi:hypothetical protein
MTVSKTNITDLAQVFCQSEADTTTIAAYFDEVIEDIARTDKPPFTAIATFNITDSTSVYAFQTAAIEIIALFFEGRQLSKAKVHELEAYDIDWRTVEGDPLTYLMEEQDSREYRLFPTPDADSASGGTEVHSTAPATSIQEWYALYIAFAVLAQEFAYISKHVDSLFVEACSTVRDVLGALLGVK